MIDETRRLDSGVHIERRRVLQLGGLLATLPLTSSRGPLWAQAASEQRDAFDEFTAVWKELAETYLESTPELEEPYLWRLASHISSAVVDTIPERQRVVFESANMTTGPCWGMGPIFVVELTLEPGAFVSPHNHPGHNVVTVGLHGSARYRHYEPVGETPPFADRESAFRVRETRRGILTRGRSSHLSRQRDNIHSFTAGPDGAVMLDFTTELAQTDFSQLAIDEAVDGFGGEQRARWKEMTW